MYPFDRDNFISPELIDKGAQAAAEHTDVIINLFKTITGGFGDKVPNYPIKSTNTYNKLVGIVTGHLPNPTSVEDAKALLAKAINLRNQEISGGNGGDANKTIIMMYAEAIKALEDYIAKGGGQYVNTVGQAGKTPTQSSNIPLSGTLGQSGNSLVWIVLLVAVLGFVIFMAVRKK